MSTFITISVDEKDTHLVEHGFKIMKDIEASLSSYKKSAVIYMLNRDKKVKLDNYSYQALKQSRELYKNSDGYFDITVGSITKDLYHFGEEERLASIKELNDAKVNFRGIHFSKNEASLDDGIKIDLGGIGKGFGVDKVAGYFRANSVEARISASGDIRCLDVCSIDVQDPFSDAKLLSFKTSKKDLGITTSGNYNRYVKSIKNNHLINPKLKRSQTKFVSITLIGSISSSFLDAYATAASVMPPKKAYEFLDSQELAYIVLQSDGDMKISSNIGEYTNSLVINNAVKK
ncbi:putative thiamine biosynthesis protein [Sulfurimonas gotlandica GD1]|uniref:FAD:protein FMN transferase n=1 Tax=Sulfurimonas gotlandica (strain DSM 19862 / JCM 16533 / GD1) TaxID=929558 RepID=B6BNL0_SULGG|nr:FAD:protein FMN transferase [Sulfurimonas gotlandica]EDZ61429.1 ApbE family [Sulfurimonas gotlandica GD1]EHP31083.1 putative thiamine biosynthesis protein [Sulfurimonas gotlandica GD1]